MPTPAEPKKFKPGIRVKATMAGGVLTQNGIRTGSILTLSVENKDGTAFLIKELLALSSHATWISTHEFEPFPSNSKADLEQEKTILTTLLQEIDAKLDWLAKSKSDIYDEREFKVYQALDLMKKTESQEEAAKSIAKLLYGS